MKKVTKMLLQQQHQHQLQAQQERKWRPRRRKRKFPPVIGAAAANFASTNRWAHRSKLSQMIVFTPASLLLPLLLLSLYTTTFSLGQFTIDSDQLTAYNSSDQSNTFLVDYSFLAANYVEDDDADTPISSDFESSAVGGSVESDRRQLWRRQAADDHLQDSRLVAGNLGADDYAADWPVGSGGGRSVESLVSGNGDPFNNLAQFTRRSPPYSQMDSSSSTLNNEQQQQDLTLQQNQDSSNQMQQKIGPQFVKEPPSFIHYLNSSDLVIPCAASGQPTPTITWWHKGVQVEMGSLLDKRYIRYDNSLVISAFKEHEFEPEIHATVYKCQAANPWGSIVSRDVVISAVIDHELQVSVGDQFVTVDNDALFKCQFPPQTRDFVQVIGWLEDGQNLIQAAGFSERKRSGNQLILSNQIGGPKSTRQQPNGQQQQPQAQQQHPSQSINQQPPQRSPRAFVLKDGQLLIQRVQLRDANKSFRCQYRNLLNSRVGLSSISGRLFVTDASESGAAPRIIESPNPISIGKLNEQLLLTCLAQGSPRPSIRWFKQVGSLGGGGGMGQLPAEQSPIPSGPSSSGSGSTSTQGATRIEWTELSPGHPDVALASDLPASALLASLAAQQSPVVAGPPTGSSGGIQPGNGNNGPNNDSSNNNNKYVISSEANLLLIRSLQHSDNRIKFKCLANNTYGMHFAETELRLEMWPSQRLIEIEPKLEFIDNNSLQQQMVTFNCTIRQSPSEPVIGIEWLKNGKLLFAYSLPQYVQSLYYTTAANSHGNFIDSTSNMTFGNGGGGGGGGGGGIISSDQQQQQNFLTSGSIFEDLNLELSSIENLQMTSQLEVVDSNGQSMGLNGGDISANGVILDQDSFAIEQPSHIISQTSINKLMAAEKELQHPQISISNLQQQQRSAINSFRNSHATRRLGPRQKLRLLARDQLLYQLQLNQVRRHDRGSYQCRARTMQTTLQATSQLMLKDNPPKFVNTFHSQLLSKSNQLAQVSLKCVASGSPLPEISWSLSGFQVPESSRFRVGDYVTRDGLIVSFVNITNVQPEDGGLYECSAANDVGQLKHSAWLNVTGPVYIRAMPSVAAIAGRSLSIMCPVGGWPVEQISWFQNSTKLPLNHRQKLTPNGTLSISELNEVTDSGKYSCQAKSAGSETVAVNHVQVSIKVPPVVEPFAFAKSLHRGQRYNVMCTVVRGDLPVQIRWFKDGRPIESLQQASSLQVSPMIGDGGHLDQEQVVISSEHSNNMKHSAAPAAGSGGIAIKQLDPYSSTLTFASLQAHHRGQYSCEATNEAGSANQSSNLVIHVPPEWKIEPKDMSVTVGRTAVIDCQADAFPAARIEWRLSQDLFREPPSEFKPITSSLYMRVFENGSLIIYNTQRTDAGYYLCQANNGVGPGLSRVIKLTVHVAAHFKSKIRTELVRRSHAAKLKCESIGDLPIDINWLKDKMPLYAADHEPRYTISKTQLADGCISELTISETDRSDSALFTCITQNQFGSDDTNIQLLVQSVPDPPLDIRIHEYEARSVKISWLQGHTGNSPITKFIVSYAQTMMPIGSAGNDQTVMQSTGNKINHHHQQQQGLHFTTGGWPEGLMYTNLTVAGNESSIQLQGLTPLTEYQFFMVAVNSLGASKLPSEPIKFRTDDEAPSAPPLLVKAQASSSKSIRVRWRAPERRAHFGSISGFYVGYKLHRPESGQTLGAGAGNVAASAAVAGAPDGTPPGGQSANYLQSANGALATDTFIYKTVELNQNTNQLMASSSVAASQDKLINGNLSASTASNNELECQLTGLRRGHKYLITVQAFNSRGAGPQSEQIVAETWRIDVPEPPSLRMVARTAHSIHLAWRLEPTKGTLSSGTDSSSDGRQQQQQQQLDSQPLVRLRHTQANGMKTRQFTTEALELIELSSENANGLTSASRNDPGKVNSSNNNNNNNSNNLDEIERQAEEAQAKEPILGFILTRKQILTPTQQGVNAQENQDAMQRPPVVEMRLPSDHLSQIVDNLTCGTRYSFTISALNSVGPSAPSEPLTVKTEGSTPVAPDKSSLLSLNSSSVIINLAAWHNGACPMRSFDILFKPSRAKKWTPLTNYQLTGPEKADGSSSKISSNRRHDSSFEGSNSTAATTATTTSNLLAQRSTYSSSVMTQQTTNGGTASQKQPLASGGANQLNNTIVLDDLSLSLNYDLKILATNEAGSTEALYTFNTNGGRDFDDAPWGVNGGDFSLADASLSELFAGSSVILPWMLFLLFTSLIMSTVCFLIVRRRHVASSTCSLSLSSASRSNQSSSNYYSTSASDTHHNHVTGGGAGCYKLTSATLEHPSSASRYATATANGAATLNRNHRNQFNEPSLDGAPSNAMSLPPNNDIYGQHLQQQQLEPSNGGHYAYLANNQGATFRPTSPQNTDLAGVISGSEAEMCLGASALDMAIENSQQQRKQADIQQNHARTNDHGQTFYMAPQLHSILGKQQQQPQHQQQQMSQLNKSSTLPTNCQQQILQQMIQQQQQQQSLRDSANHEQIIDNLMAANMMQQQQVAAAETYLANLQANAAAAAAVAAVQAGQQSGNGSGESAEAAAQMAQLLEQQLHHQVYATVKRGCPRPPMGPRLCDYSIYQCPTESQNQNQNLQQQQQQQDTSYLNSQAVNEQQQHQQLMQCCANLESPIPQVAGDVQDSYTNRMGQMSNQGQIQLNQQQLISNYQQLRPN